MRRVTVCGFMALCLLLVMAGEAPGAEAPLTVHMDTLSTPTLGGTGRLIWAAMPGTPATGAVLTFSLEAPGQPEPQCTSQTLTLQPGRVAEATYSFASPCAGLYRVTALLWMTAGGQQAVSSRVATFTVVAPGKLAASPLSAPVITPLTVDGTQAYAELGQGATAWYSFKVTRQTIYTITATPAYGISGAHVYLYGPDSQSKVVAEELSIQGNPLVYYTMLAPGTYYLQVLSSKTTQAGSITVGVATFTAGAPRVTALAINGGDATTFERYVTLNMTCTGYPSEYMASESASFAGATWLPYAGSVPFVLTPTEGNKTVYVKVRDLGGGVSGARSDAIALQRLIPLGANGEYSWGNIETAGAADWFVFDVTTESNYDLRTSSNSLNDTYLRLYGPNSTSILIAENDDWRSAAGYTLRDARLLTHLTPGTYYVKVQAHGATDIGSYAIQLTGHAGPIIADVAINDNAYEIYNRRIGVTFNAVGTITDYRIGETPTLDGVAWQAYGGRPRVLYTLASAGDGYKTVYLQLRDKATGQMSTIVSETVKLFVSKPLTLGQAAQGQITATAQANVFDLTTTNAGDYLLEITPDPADANGNWLQDFDVYVYYPDKSYYGSYQEIINQKKAQIALKGLTPGTRHIKIQSNYTPYAYGNSPWYRGKYTVRVTQYTATTPLVAEFHLVTSALYGGISEHYTATRTVELRSTLFGNTPAQYKISERSDFRGASWLSWGSNLTFNLSSGSDSKTVYFKVKDSAGHESAVVSDTIQLIEPKQLKIGAAAVTAYHGMDWPEVFEFTVTTAGTYTIEVTAGDSNAVGMLYDLELAAEVYSSGGFSRSSSYVGSNFPWKGGYSLTPGTYRITIDNYPLGINPDINKGNYKIRVY